MLAKEQENEVREKCLEYFNNANIVLTKNENNNIEITDFGLNRLEELGLQLITYVNTNRVCAKELILLPWQICPEHRHPEINGNPGKEETFRCRWGKVYLYVPGKETAQPKGKIPKDKEKYFTVWHEIILNPGEQYTLIEDTLHWFQASSRGAIISEFSTRSVDEKDIFTDPEIRRIPEVKK